MAALSGVFSVQQFTDLGGPLIGGRLYTYAFGTTTQKTAYTDVDGNIPHTYTSDGLGGQYIALNARGELPAPLYLAAGSYDLALKRADGSTVFTRRAEATANATELASLTDSAKGSSLMGWLRNATGAIGRYVSDKLTEAVTLEDFGAVGNGTTDDTAAFNSAQAYLTRGGIIRGVNGKKYYLAGNQTLAKGICFRGTWTTREDVAVFDPVNNSTALLLDGTATFSIGNGAEVCNWLVWRKGLVAATGATDSATKVAAFAGTAFTAAANDAKLRHNTIIGFNKAGVSNAFERVLFEHNHFDCTNGFEVQQSFDIGHVCRNHAWPFFTAHQSWTTGPLLQRSGIAFKVFNSADFIHVERNFAYGYSTSYYIEDLAAATVSGNKADNVFASATGRIGYETRGTMNNVVFENNHCDSHDVNYRFAHTAGCLIGGTNTSGQSVGPSIQCGASSRGSFGRFSLAGTCQYAIVFLLGIGRWRIDSMVIGSEPSTGSLYSIQAADLSNVQIGWTTRYNITAADNFGYGSVANPSMRVSHDSTSGLSQTLADGSMVMSVNGKPAFVWQPKTNAVNFLTSIAGATGEKVTLAPDGEANVTLALIPKGTGSIQLGTSYVGGAPAATGYVTMIDAGGVARKFLVG